MFIEKTRLINKSFPFLKSRQNILGCVLRKKTKQCFRIFRLLKYRIQFISMTKFRGKKIHGAKILHGYSPFPKPNKIAG